MHCNNEMLYYVPPLLPLPLVPPRSLPLSLHLIQSLSHPPPYSPLSSTSSTSFSPSTSPPLFNFTHPGIGLAVPNGGFGATSINVLEGFIDPLVGMNRVLNDVKISVLKNVLNNDIN
jgi:hypothetical protein